MCHLGGEGGESNGKTKIVGNNTLIGQIATFKTELGLSYREVVYEIPYQNLLIMQADKLHAVSEDEPEIKKISGKDMMKKKTASY